MADPLRKFASKTENVATGSNARFYGRSEALAELAADTAAREKKTARLREARLVKERKAMMATTAAKIVLGSRKS